MYGHNPTLVDEETGDTLEPCNDCGVLILLGDELCARCRTEELDREEEERMHPEWRCPPRE